MAEEEELDFTAAAAKVRGEFSPDPKALFDLTPVPAPAVDVSLPKPTVADAPEELDFSAAAGRIREQAERASTVRSTLPSDPERYSKDRELSRVTGVPIPVVERNREEVEADQQAAEISAMLAGAWTTSGFYDSPIALRVAGVDGTRALTGIEKIARTGLAIGQSVPQGALDFLGMGLEGLGENVNAFHRSRNRLIEQGLSVVSPDLLSLWQSLPNIPWYLDPGEILRRPGAETLRPLADWMAPAKELQGLETEVAQGAGQLAGQVLMYYINPAAATALMFGQGGAQQADKIKAAKAEPSANTDTAILMGSAVTALTERYGVDKIWNRIPEVVRSRIGRILASATTEYVQEFTEQLLQNMVAWSLYNKDQNLMEGAVEGAEVGGLVGAIAGAVIPGRRAVQNRQTLQELHEAIMGSPVTERAPDLAAEHFMAVLNDLGAEGVSIPADQLLRIASTTDQPQALLESLGVDETIMEAAARGADVQIAGLPFSRHVMQDPKVFNVLRDYIRLGGQGEMTAAEAQEYAKSGVREEMDALARMQTAAGTPVVEPSETAAPAPTEADRTIKIAEYETGLHGLFQNAAEAGMSDAEYQQYLLKVALAKDTAVKREQGTILRAQEQQKSEEWAALREREKAVATEAATQEPVYAAMDAIQSERLDRETVLELFQGDETQLAKLPRQKQFPGDKGRMIYSKKGERGIHPDMLAEQFGFDGGDVLLYAMQNADPKEVWIEKRTDELMKEKHTALATERQKISSAIEALHNTDEVADLLAYEINWMRKAKGEKLISARAVKQYAREGMQNMLVKDIRPGEFQLNEGRLGKKIRQLVKSGDRTGAVATRFQQLVQYFYSHEAYGVQKKVEKQRKEMNKFLRPRKAHRAIEAEFVDKIRDTLAPHDINEKYAGMTLQQWTELYGTVKQLEANGRAAKMYRVAGKTMEFVELREQLLATVAEVPTRKGTQKARTDLTADSDRTIGSRLAGFDAAGSKMEFLIQALDHGQVAGPWHQAIFRRISDAQTAEKDALQQQVLPLVKELRAMPRAVQKFMHKKFVVAGLTMRGSQITMMLLNSGNEGNYSKMIEGSEKRGSDVIPLSPEVLDEAFQKVPPEVARWAQKVWDRMDVYYPQVEQIYREENGIAPEKVITRELTVAGEKLRGGYWPVMYDPRYRGITRGHHESALDLLGHIAIRSGVDSSMTKARTGYSAPVQLDINFLPRGLEESIHYVTHYQTIKDVNRLLSDEQLSTAVHEKLGPEYLKEMKNWLEAVATENIDPRASRALDDIASYLRGNMTAAVLGMSYTANISQTFGLTNSVATLGRGDDGKFSHSEGLKWMAVGLDQYAADPARAAKDVQSLSGEMRHRIDHVDRDISNMIERLSLGNGALTRHLPAWFKASQRASLQAIGGIQLYAVDMPTWIGAYNKALAQNHADPVGYADSIVRQSQGSGQLKDLTALQRQRGLMRWATMFATYTTALYSQTKQAVNDGRKLKNIPGTVGRLMWLVALAALIDGLVRDEEPREGKDDPATWYALRVLSHAVQSIPLFGSAAQAVMRGFDGTIAPPLEVMTRSTKSAARVTEKLVTGEDLTDKEVMSVMRGAGTFLGIPGTFQMIRGFEALEQDGEFYEYLVGPKKK